MFNMLYYREICYKFFRWIILDSDKLKEVGLKITAARVKILNTLAESKEGHLTAEDIYKVLIKEGEEISIATVYRVLTQFEVAGLLIRHKFEGDQAVFELNDKEHHDHMVCTECKKVIEFNDELIEKQQEVIAAKNNFLITDHALYIYGVCASCR